MSGIDIQEWRDRIIPNHLIQLEAGIWACYISLARPPNRAIPTAIKAGTQIDIRLHDVSELTWICFENGMMAGRWLGNLMGMRLSPPPSDGEKRKLTPRDRDFVFKLPIKRNPSDVFITTLGGSVLNEAQAFVPINGFSKEDVKSAVWRVLEYADNAIAHPTDGRGFPNLADCSLGLYAIHQLAKRHIYETTLKWKSPPDTTFLEVKRVPHPKHGWCKISPPF